LVQKKILIVDDEPAIRFGIRNYLEAQGYDVREAAGCQGAVEIFRSSRPDVAVLDYLLLDGNVIDLLPRLKEIDPSIPLVILTAHGTIDLAVRGIKAGAEYFLTKPVELAALLVILERAIENQRNRQKQLAEKSRWARQSVDPFLGTSAAMRHLAEDARRVVTSEIPVLIQGETGTGKGVLARWLHENGPRSEEAFVDLNCAGLSREFLETELFGHSKGAFTGAVMAKLGLLDLAHGGTLFLDEIGDVGPEVQPKLLKVLEEKRFRRVGDVRDRRVDIRLIAATHQDLAGMVGRNQFRADLYYRINAIPLFIPALRERVEDIGHFARHLMEGTARDQGRGEIALSAEAVKALEAYPWPGNIRELGNVLARASLLSGRSVLTAGDLRLNAFTTADPPSAHPKLSLRDVERQQIEAALHDEDGHVDRAAKGLGIPKSTLYQKIKQYGITLRGSRTKS